MNICGQADGIMDGVGSFQGPDRKPNCTLLQPFTRLESAAWTWRHIRVDLIDIKHHFLTSSNISCTVVGSASLLIDRFTN